VKLRVLGCSGGVGAGLRTTSFLVNDDMLIDCGSGVGDLFLEEMSRVRHIFLTHSHLDHICFLPFMVDSIFDRIIDPIVIHGLEETIETLKKHIFNWAVWPDFSQLPTPERAVIRFEVMKPGESVWVEGRTVEMIPVNHTVPAVGYRVAEGDKSFAFTGDTTTNDTFWDALNQHSNLDMLVVETAFANRQSTLAQMSHHYCPSLLAQDLAKLKHRPEVYLTHLKPGEEMAILAEAKVAVQQYKLKTLVGDEVFQL
jgi:ribonuclease BN (tRNA processing enzyme)